MVDWIQNTPLALQLVILAVIWAFFFIGLLMRAWWDRDALNSRQALGGGVIVFVTCALPLCEVIYHAVVAGSTIFAFMSSCVPTFTFGVTAKEQMRSLTSASAAQTG